MGNMTSIISKNTKKSAKDIIKDNTLDSAKDIIKDNTLLIQADSSISEFTLNDTYIQGKVVDVYDGDTLRIVLNINDKLIKYNCRMLLIDSPEICPKNIEDLHERELEIFSAVKSRNYLIKHVINEPIINTKLSKNDIKELCAKSTKLIWVKCFKFEKYGRLLVELYNSENDIISINQLMIDNKYALKYDGKKKKKFSSKNFN